MSERVTYKFLDVFQESTDGALTPKFQIEVNGIVLGPGIVFQKGVAYGGVDFFIYKYRDIVGETQENGTVRILGFVK